MIEDQSVLVLIVATLLSLLAYSTHDMYTFVVSLDDFSFRRNGLNGLTRRLQLNYTTKVKMPGKACSRPYCGTYNHAILLRVSQLSYDVFLTRTNLLHKQELLIEASSPSGVGDLHLYKQPRHRSYFGTQTSIDSMQACPRYLRFITRWKV